MRQILHHRYFRIIGGLFLFVCFGLAISFAMRPRVTMNDPFDDRPFDQAIWLQHRNDFRSDNPRGLMAHDLATIVETKRLTRAEVLALLGEPDGESRDPMLSYELGMWSGFRMDHDTFDIYFDSTGRVDDARVVQH